MTARALSDAWYVIAASDEVRCARPVGRRLLGSPVVVFRTQSGQAAALEDRCPHRNAPLSLGRVVGSCMECPYHGWRFDPQGRCTAIPGLTAPPSRKSHNALAYPVAEQDGWIWMYSRPHEPPAEGPPHFPALSRSYAVTRTTFDFAGSLHAVAENALDVVHTAFLHRGLFRGAGSTTLEAEVQRHHDRVEVRYSGEGRPAGLLGKLLAPHGGEVEHSDRFFLPCLTQVEYRLGESHLLATSALTPVSESETRMYALVGLRLPARGMSPVVTTLAKPLALWVLRQDAHILAAQQRRVSEFGRPRFVSTNLDTMGPHIAWLLNRARRGQSTPLARPYVRKIHIHLQGS